MARTLLVVVTIRRSKDAHFSDIIAIADTIDTARIACQADLDEMALPRNHFTYEVGPLKPFLDKDGGLFEVTMKERTTKEEFPIYARYIVEPYHVLTQKTIEKS